MLLSGATERLRAAGVATLGVVATTPERARLYFKLRPPRVPLAADPALTTHRAFGVPSPPLTPDLMKAVEATRINPTGELPEPLPIMAASAALDRLDNFEHTAADQSDQERAPAQMVAQFLIDRDGIVRWANIECGTGNLGELGTFPTEEQLLAAVRASL